MMRSVPIHLCGVRITPTLNKTNLRINIPALFASELGVSPSSAVNVLFTPSFFIVKPIRSKWHLEKEWEYKRLDGYRLSLSQTFCEQSKFLPDDDFFAFLTNYAIILAREVSYDNLVSDLEYELLGVPEKRN